ncbi:hypothetical protein GHK92_14295 [Nocardioides sp. dk4132]|uniref:DUF6049 family protein n=1 Tax=unclassified Nocardioides TaxID=2615069 RepID=UPI001297513C|nr:MULTISPECIES: DUF6049 family protein [unclassified Nocardioides]MQW77049.1 hypothetical protein [Nocardioides sp. dk4132]QGA09454.1 hypothetical protein GFH29_20200 [Nocardioides sp. dk884]
MVRPRSLLPALVALATLAAPLGTASPAAAMRPDSPVAGSQPVPAPAAPASRSSHARTTADTGSPAISTSLATSGRSSLANAATTAPVRAEDEAPLAISIGSLAPAAVPQRGAVRVTGTVTNLDNVPWSTINLYPFVSGDPLTTREELTGAATTDASAFVGERITDPGPFATIKRLAPGESATYTVRVPRSALPISGDPGVYWFGVHALGESRTSARDGLADGRARTFLPLVRGAKASTPVDTAIVVPLRRQVAHADDGSLADVDGWTSTLAPGGRLRSLVEFGAAAGSRPITWLVDPAVSDAARRLAAGNPARTTGPTLDPDEGDDPDLEDDPEATADPEATLSPAPGGGAGEDDGSGEGDGGDDADEEPAPDPAADAASTWLERLSSALGSGQVLALPYGDLDVSAAAAHDRPVYRQARARSADSLRQLAPDATPVITSPGGYLERGAMRLATKGTTVMIGDRMLGAESDAPGVVSVDKRPVAVFSSATETGGPGPDDPLALVAVRQRLLAEAAVRHLQADLAAPSAQSTTPATPSGADAVSRAGATASGPDPLVVVLPDSWVPAGTTGFFQGLDLPWLRLTTVEDITDDASAEVPEVAERLDYPESVQSRELTATDFGAARALERAGQTLQNLLRRNDRVAGEVTDEALTNLSYASRVHPSAARRRAEASRSWIDTRLRSILIEAPPSVTLSSTSGRFSATVTNNLDEPVTVAIDAIADGPIVIEGPDTVELAPRSRRTVLLTASTERQGVHNVTLVVTDLEGTALGSSDQLPIRAAQFSVVIWVIIGVGLALFVGAVAVRVVRTVRTRRRAAEQDAGPEANADTTDTAPDSQETPA